MKSFALLLAFLAGASLLHAQVVLSNKRWQAQIDEKGRFVALSYFHQEAWESIPLLKDSAQGVRWFSEVGNQVQPITLSAINESAFNTLIDSLSYQLEYKLERNNLVLLATLKNTATQVKTTSLLGLNLGIGNAFNPTQIHCEPTFFWGALTDGHGSFIGMASPDTVVAVHGGHTTRVDLLRPGTVLAAGEQRHWRIILTAVMPGQDLQPALSSLYMHKQ